MTSKPLTPGLVALAAAGCVLAACVSPSDPHGSPILTQVYWSSTGLQQLVWSREVDPALVSAVSPFADEVDFVFDRRLDGSRIEDIQTINGVVEPVPKTPAAIEATWADMSTLMSDPPFKLVVDYNSVALFGGQTAYVLARPDVPGFPSGDTIKFELVLASLTSAYGDVATAPPSVSVMTTAFSVSIGAPPATVTTTFELPLAFSNRLPAVPAGGVSPSIHVTAAGADVPYKLLADASLRSRWYLAPADCLGAWPANATLTVTIDADLGDAFGVPLAQGRTATFATVAASGIARDAACPIADAGASDGGASVDGALEAGAEGGTGADGPNDGGAIDGAGDDGGLGDAADVPASPGDAADVAPDAVAGAS